MEKAHSAYGPWLAYVMNAKRVSSKKLAKQAGISSSIIDDLVSGKIPPEKVKQEVRKLGEIMDYVLKVNRNKKIGFIAVIIAFTIMNVQFFNDVSGVGGNQHQNNTMTQLHLDEYPNIDPLNIIKDITILANENRGLEQDLGNLANYEAPIFVWDEIVLKRGENRSDVLKQTPIKLQDGRVEDNKAIIVSRGFMDNSTSPPQFTLDSEGKWFMIEFIKNGQLVSVGSGKLEREVDGWGFGLAMSCWRPIVSVADVGDSGEFNCFYKTVLEEDDSVRVLWTMLHREDFIEKYGYSPVWRDVQPH
ncbi:MAG: helix-turn-helix transcriptional regulator [Nitrososphaeraceae archaeon]